MTVLPTTVQSVIVSVSPRSSTPPPKIAELPLIVQSVIVVVPSRVYRPPPDSVAELPLTTQSVRGERPVHVLEPAAVVGGASGDGQPRERRGTLRDLEDRARVAPADGQQGRPGSVDRDRRRLGERQRCRASE